MLQVLSQSRKSGHGEHEIQFQASEKVFIHTSATPVPQQVAKHTMLHEPNPPPSALGRGKGHSLHRSLANRWHCG